MAKACRQINASQGFSLAEVLVVTAIALLTTALAVPNVVNVVANTRLRANMGSLASLMQDCRMIAIKTNQPQVVHFGVQNTGEVAWIEDPSDAQPSLTASSPQVRLGAPISKVDTPPGSNPTALDSTTLSFTPLMGVEPSFNARGLPCQYSRPGTCTSNGFVFYFTDTRPLNQNGWAAISITPAGRIKAWYWNGSAWAN